MGTFSLDNPTQHERPVIFGLCAWHTF